MAEDGKKPKGDTFFEKMVDKIQGHDEKRLHKVFGGGKTADLFLWKDKKVSAGVLGGVTAIWVLFVVLEYNLIALVSHGLILALALSFLWSNATTFINKSPPHIPKVDIPEDPVLKLASELRIEINQALASLRDIALGKDLKMFLCVIAGLWMLSLVGSCCDFLTLLYISVVLLFTVPIFYDKYEHHVDSSAEKAMAELKKQYAVFDAKGGILLGPSALGRNQKYLNAIFPPRSLTVLDTLANLGLLFFLFLVGLELDPKALRRTGKKALSIAVAGISLPFVLGIGTSFLLRHTISEDTSKGPFLVFMGVALSITAFPVLARILAELKLLTTDVGRMAMSAAAINDMAAWILLALAIALSGTDRSPIVTIWVFLSGSGFVMLCIFVAPRIFKWMAQRCGQGEPVDEIYVCATLAAVLAAAFVTDTIGIHALFGAFVLGVLVPKEAPFAISLVEKLEDLVSGLFLPLYFVSSGLKTNVATIQGAQSWGLLVLVIFTACFGKIVGTVCVSLWCKVPFREALTLGFLMNTKGLVELIVLNIGKDRGVLNDQTFAIMVLMALFTTFITTPFVITIFKPANITKPKHKHRTIQRKESNTQLRMLACFHSTRNIPTLINLMEISRGTGKRGGLHVYAMHLMELSERSSAILMALKARNNGMPFWRKSHDSDKNQIVVAFEAFQRLSQVSVRPTTAISAMSSMHIDICKSAQRKGLAIIILPFHKHPRVDGHLETTRVDLRYVNRRVLENAPCSVAILVDRGLGGLSHVSASNVAYVVTVLFFGGQDDRESLSYAALMAEHPGITLNVVRFIVDANVVGDSIQVDVNSDDNGEETTPDEQFIKEVKERVSNNDSIRFEDSVVRDAAEMVDSIRTYSRCNLFLVGRMPEGQLVEALNKKGECPELGPVANLLISADFSTAASVLVVQQYRGKLTGDSLSSLQAED